ncbi:two-component sensor histidine kinase [Streptomyces umbrinus]|uniref:Two-component sensor histidine kinase n=1 Tax=Streptomyces umbrinus TaxID=67370 RepID=A0ABU0SHD2_9ACTN|nr:ATP-binding protein [Streptomyces umbrinus]MDQ1022642.1 two-component sensor histidine kinase [Streptomyces umbrinus]
MPRTPVRHDFPVISTPGHVPVARHETAKILIGWGMSDEVVDTSCLIITELVTNVVRHAAVVSPTATVTLAVEDEGGLVLAVADAHPFKPKPLLAAHGFGGRGLHLVDALVREADGKAEVVPDAATGGKQIIIHLPLALD